MNTTSLNARERKARRLLAHYATCERLARYLANLSTVKHVTQKDGQKAVIFGSNIGDHLRFDGKRISVALFKLEKLANAGATAWCNGEFFRHSYGFGNAHTSGAATLNFNFPGDEHAWDKFADYVTTRLCHIFSRSHKYPPAGFFVNGDCRGYALKIDNGNPKGKALIEAVGLQRDMGGYGILSPEINGDR